MKIVARMSSLSSAAVWVGIDVSKKTLDVAIWLGEKRYKTVKFQNTVAGIEKLLAWVQSWVEEGTEFRFCMEATGDYHLLLAIWLSEQGYHVSVANPANVRFYALGEGLATKTDKADSKAIAKFASEKNPRPGPFGIRQCLIYSGSTDVEFNWWR